MKAETERKREKLSSFEKGLTEETGYDLFGARTIFRKIITRYSKNIAEVGEWFCFCTGVSKEQVDIMASRNDKGISIGSMVAEDFQNSMYRTAVYKYLLRDFLCYYERPTTKKKYGYQGYTDTYEKLLITSNLHIAALWLGISLADAKKKYGARVDEVNEDSESPEYQYLRLYVSTDGTHKVTRPKKNIDLSLSGTRVIPLIALKAGLDVLYDKASKDFYDVSFKKDNGQIRTVNVCFNISKLREIYKNDAELVAEYDKQYKGDFMANETLARGYIRAIEVGTNLMNGALRSINFARIINYKKAKPDLTYIDIDLSTVKENFIKYIQTTHFNVVDMVHALDEFNVGDERKYGGKALETVGDLEKWAESETMLISTPFLKQLALFMIGNPQWFKGYTGKDMTKEIDESEVDDLLGENDSDKDQKFSNKNNVSNNEANSSDIFDDDEFDLI